MGESPALELSHSSVPKQPVTNGKASPALVLGLDTSAKGKAASVKAAASGPLTPCGTQVDISVIPSVKPRRSGEARRDASTASVAALSKGGGAGVGGFWRRLALCCSGEAPSAGTDQKSKLT